MEIRKRLSPRGVLKEDNLVIHFLSPLLFLFFFLGPILFFGLYFTFSLLTLLSFSLLPTNTHSSDPAVTMSSITRARVFLPPQKSEQAASAGRGTDVYTHVWIFGKRFWRHRAELSLPYNTAVFYSQLPLECYMNFRFCVPAWTPTTTSPNFPLF